MIDTISRFYLSLILGSNLNLSLLNRDNRYRYKQEYEKFKVTVSYAALFFFTLSIFDMICSFLMVWYYCTLTIREAILSKNGSKIKGWWKIHHYVSCVICAFVVTWKDGLCYEAYRNQFLIFNIYIALVQLLQCRYQNGCLRRLHALGQRHSMDITVEGFSSWMFKGLTFLIPFLVVAYAFQFYNAYTIFVIYRTMDCSGQWQVPALAIAFLFVACANTFTLIAVLINKWKKRSSYSALLELIKSGAPKAE
ncbi:unnamed protein product [Dracunculus medinensis]|uniref:Uncharacterized protein n=1 Tax=Dracunculus medinensis TaxID=318479 RepID=A0A3P7PJT3_DRAME|nr:unnamed protein product [Dracunculus medinensis]